MQVNNVTVLSESLCACACLWACARARICIRQTTGKTEPLCVLRRVICGAWCNGLTGCIKYECLCASHSDLLWWIRQPPATGKGGLTCSPGQPSQRESSVILIPCFERREDHWPAHHRCPNYAQQQCQHWDGAESVALATQICHISNKNSLMATLTGRSGLSRPRAGSVLSRWPSSHGWILALAREQEW